ncbi:hypothetical protein D9758_018029 [Tetrapyrgos nigripes]|uniref:DUF6533 domain-containing protein n=1 Tax=Tetrapyrgos nigripes TaxID=182062 RepID=A0A8H5CDT4_9AGAR|nr:hypothetical protein D9758_018029 [Tetrapyrgos nigripes]
MSTQWHWLTVMFLDLIDIISADEVNYIWTRPKILSSYCFLIIRYWGLFGTIPVTVVKFSMMSTSVHAIQFLLDGLDHFESYDSIWFPPPAYIRALRTKSSNFGYYGGRNFVRYWDCLDQGTVTMELHPKGTPNPLDTSSSLRISPLFINTMEILAMRHYYGFNAQVPDPLIALLFRDGLHNRTPIHIHTQLFRDNGIAYASQPS